MLSWRRNPAMAFVVCGFCLACLFTPKQARIQDFGGKKAHTDKRMSYNPTQIARKKETVACKEAAKYITGAFQRRRSRILTGVNFALLPGQV